MRNLRIFGKTSLNRAILGCRSLHRAQTRIVRGGEGRDTLHSTPASFGNLETVTNCIANLLMYKLIMCTRRIEQVSAAGILLSRKTDLLVFDQALTEV